MVSKIGLVTVNVMSLSLVLFYYQMVEEIEAAMKGLFKPEYDEEISSNKAGCIAGGM